MTTPPDDTEARLAAIAQRAAAASKGPWAPERLGTDMHVRGRNAVRGIGLEAVYVDQNWVGDEPVLDITEETLTFICESITDIPWLLEQVARLRADLRHARLVATDWHDHGWAVGEWGSTDDLTWTAGEPYSRASDGWVVGQEVP